MERDEAKNILQLCHPNSTADQADPLIAEAFKLLDTDAELLAWFEAEQAFDSQMTDAMNSIPVPTDLKASILAGMRAHEHGTKESTEEPIPFAQSAEVGATHSSVQTKQQSWWLNPWIGIAAAFVFMLAIVIAPRLGNDNVQLAQNDPALAEIPHMVRFISDQLDSNWSFDKKSKQSSELTTFLASTGAPAPNSIPSSLEGMPSIGCAAFEYRGSQLSLICFKEGDIYHLTVSDATNFSGELPTEPQFFEIEDKAFKLWVEDDQVKVLTVIGTKKDLPEFI